MTWSGASTGEHFVAANPPNISGNPSWTYAASPSTHSGWTFNKPNTDTTTAPGLWWQFGGADQWLMGLDTLGSDFVFAYDPLLPQGGGTTGDTFRTRHGAYFIMGPAIGQPANTRRLELVAAANDTTVQQLVFYTNATGSSLADFVRGNGGSGEVYNVDIQGRAGFGAPYFGYSAGAMVEVKKGVHVWTNDGSTAPQVQISQKNGANANTWLLSVPVANGQLSFVDNSTQNEALIIAKGALQASLQIAGGGLVNFGNAPTTTVAPGAGGAGALPATPTGYMSIQVGALTRKVAYY